MNKFLHSVPYLALVLVLGLSGQVKTYADSTITVDGSVKYQPIDGFGASDAFRTGAYIRGAAGDALTDAQTNTIMDLLFSTTKGAGFSIIRHEIGSGSASSGADGDNQPSIEPDDPGGPNAKPTYRWNTSDPHLDGDQVWFSKTAMGYGAITFIADAWSAPAYMKTTNALKGGGYLCGVPGQSCPGGDWRQAYANYLTQYATFYHAAGIDLAYIGYINEPEYSPTGYTGMNFDTKNEPNGNGGRGAIDKQVPQNIDFIKNYLGPTLAASGLKTRVLCCDATSWENMKVFTIGIMADPNAEKYLGLVSGHGYYTDQNGLISSPITPAANLGIHSWETETSTFDKFNPAWDDGSDASGFQWGQNLWSALVNGNANGYLYWWFAELNGNNSDNEGLININGSDYTISKRLWAFANYSRFIRPGAIRIDGKTSDANLNLSAFQNTDGSYVVVVLNGNKTDTPISISLKNVTAGESAVPYLTNQTNDLVAQTSVNIAAGTLAMTIPARSLVTFAIH